LSRASMAGSLPDPARRAGAENLPQCLSRP
jgi:hypothetical protein